VNPQQEQGDERESRAARPNAAYKLSGEDSGGPDSTDNSGLVFYYNREKRLEKAPQPVRELYTVQNKKGFNLLRPLVGNKSNAILFFTILVLSVSLIVLTLTGNLDTSYTIDGNRLSISAVRYEGTAIVTLKKALDKGNTRAYSGAVDVAVAPAVQDGEGDFPVFYHRVFFSLAQEEEYRFAVPFDPPELVLVLQTEKSTLKAKIKTK
jgi:hypothetical protein